MRSNLDSAPGGATGVNMFSSRRAIALSALFALRPKQWTKNAVVFAALVFDHRLFNTGSFVSVFAAFSCFCLASSAVYLVNDIADTESDRQHPRKRYRPIASGAIPVGVAWIAALALGAIALLGALSLRPGFAAVIAGYLALMGLYTYVLKHLAIIDVFAISAGFVLRAVGGAVVLDVPISPWLYVCTVLLSLFIGFGKRRHELLLLEDGAAAHRRNLSEYSPMMLDQFILISAASTVMAYALYTFTSPALPDSHAMMLTIPFVLYAMFRYLFLIHRRDEGGSPEQLLLTDAPLFVSIALWGLTAIAILYTA